MEAVEELVKKLNNYGHEISVSDLVRDYYWKLERVSQKHWDLN
jgi:hypothetical protein